MRTPIRGGSAFRAAIVAAVAGVLVAAAMPGVAADLTVTVGAGRSVVADAVVTVAPAQAGSQGPVSALPDIVAIDQRDLAFVPYVQVARPGAAAVFHNSDSTRHHVYSFSPAATFEMVLGPGEASRRVPLDDTGVVAIGCNIHDQMIAWLVVSDAPWVARTGPDGQARFPGLPAGDYRVRVWHPRLPVRDAGVERRVSLDGAAPVSLAVALRLRPGTRLQPDRERADY